MMFDVKSITVLLVLIYGVSSYPHPNDSKAKDSKVFEANSKKHDVVVFEKRRNLKKDNIVEKTRFLRDDHQTFTKTDKKGKDNVAEEQVDNQKLPYKKRVDGKSVQRIGGAAMTGKVELNKKEIVGAIELPSDGYQNHAGGEQIDNQGIEENKNADVKQVAQQKEGALTGSVETNEENIEGHVQLSGDVENSHQEDLISEINSGNRQKEGAITGNVDVNDENFEGHIEFPSDSDNLNQYKANSNNQQNEPTISGSIEMNDKSIEGHIELPSNVDNLDQKNPIGESNNVNQKNEKTLTGSIETNEEYIAGNVDLPSDVDNLGQENPIGGSNNVKQQKEDALTGSIETNDEYVNGHVELPSQIDKENNSLNNDDAVTGSVGINDENIEGNIELPNNYEPEQYIQGIPGSNNMGTDDLSGSFKDIKDDNFKGNVNFPHDENKKSKRPSASGKNCWMTLSSASHHLDALDKIDATYANARQKYQDDVGKEFDKKMMQVMIESQGAAPRAVHQAQGDASRIPAGINLGGYCMMRMPGSVLFFHRMKLRNSTRFSVNYLQTDLMKMSLVVRLSLNDLHLVGAYERAISDRKPGTLHYVPNYGEVEMLLKNVYYKMEGRLRLLNNRLIVEVVNSDLINNDILMTYANDSSSIRLQPRNIEDFLERLKADLDLWLKDYFNDYLMYFGIVGGSNSEIQTYEKKKTIQANEYADDVIKDIKYRLRSLGAASVKIPSFKIISTLHAGQIKLMDGQLRGLDSIYRRSVSTTKKEKNIRQLDIIIGFSNLKLEYKYEAAISPEMPPLSGKLILSADELTAHLELAQLGKPATIDLNIDSIIQTKPDSLTIEGPASRMIANFKQLLEHPIIAIMTNTMKHNIKMMKTLTRCEPYIYGTKNRQAGDDQSDPLGDSFIEDTVPDNTEDLPPAPQDDPVYEIPIKEEQNNDINDNLNDNVHLGDGDSDLSPEANGNSNDMSDYVLKKNDSVEIEVPVNGKLNRYKLNREEHFVISKVP